MPTTATARKRRARRRRAATAAPRPVRSGAYIAQVLPAAARPARVSRRRRNRRKTNSLGRGAGTTVRLSFLTDTLKGDSSGAIKFGPSCSYSEALMGILKAFQKYRITQLSVRWMSEAASTDRGSMSYHVDTSLKQTASSMKALTKWSLRNAGNATFASAVLADTPWIESTSDQFAFLYKGSGDSNVAGTMAFSLTVVCSNPK